MNRFTHQQTFPRLRQRWRKLIWMGHCRCSRMFSDVLRYSVPKSGTKRAVPPHNVKRKPLIVKDVFLPGHGNFSRRDLAMGIFLYQVPPNSSGQVQKTERRHMESSDAQSLLWQRTSRVQQGLCLTSIVRPVHSLGVSYAPLRG